MNFLVVSQCNIEVAELHGSIADPQLAQILPIVASKLRRLRLTMNRFSSVVEQNVRSSSVCH